MMLGLFAIPLTAFVVMWGLTRMQSQRFEHEDKMTKSASNNEIQGLLEKVQKDLEEQKKQVSTLMLKVGFKL